MLTFTRPHRQILGTLALLAGTVVPTAFVGLTAWRINRPGHLHDVEAEFGSRLGLKLTLESVRYPQPGEVVYGGAVLWQEEPRQKSKLVEVARADRLHASWIGRQLVLRAEGLRLTGEGPQQALAQAGDLLRRAGDASWDRVSLTAPACQITLGTDGEGEDEPALRFALRDLAGTFRAEPGAPTVEASYRIVDREGAANRCELKLVRDRRGAQVRTSLALKTAEGPPLPARVLAPFFDPSDWLGPDARVLGSLTLAQSGAGPWEADFAGQLHDVELASLLGDRVPDHRLQGRALVSIASAHWGPRPSGRAPGWISAEGELAAGPGAISSSLLKALQAEMRFRLSDHVDLGSDEQEFQNLGLRFQMRPDGEVLVSGRLGGSFEPGAVLSDANGLASLAFAPREGSNLLSLRRTLGPPDADQAILVPATPELGFLDYLPIPSNAPRDGSAVAN